MKMLKGSAVGKKLHETGYMQLTDCSEYEVA